MTITETIELAPITVFCKAHGFHRMTRSGTMVSFWHVGGRGELEFRFNEFGLVGASIFGFDKTGSYAVDVDSDGHLTMMRTDGYRRMMTTRLGREFRAMVAAVVRLTGSRMTVAADRTHRLQLADDARRVAAARAERSALHTATAADTTDAVYTTDHTNKEPRYLIRGFFDGSGQHYIRVWDRQACRFLPGYHRDDDGAIREVLAAGTPPVIADRPVPADWFGWEDDTDDMPPVGQGYGYSETEDAQETRTRGQ